MLYFHIIYIWLIISIAGLCFSSKIWLAFLLHFSSGLAAAYKLKTHGLNVTLYEAEGRAGGKLRTVSHGGLIWDEGANTMVSLLENKFGKKCISGTHVGKPWVVANSFERIATMPILSFNSLAFPRLIAK